MTRLFNRKEQTKLRRRLRSESPKAERLLWSRLRGKQMEDLKFRRQYGVDEYVIDFYCPAAKLAIEIDGESHYEPQCQPRDARRQACIESFGIRVLRFTNPEVYEQLDKVLDEIWRVAMERVADLKGNPPESPLGKGGGRSVVSPPGEGGRPPPYVPPWKGGRVMSAPFSTFDRLKAKGLAAYQSGEYLTARTYLIDAAECMIELAEKAKSPEARRQHEEIAAELVELAKEAAERAGDPKHGGTRQVGTPGLRGFEGKGGAGAGRVGIAHQKAGGSPGAKRPGTKQRTQDDDEESDANDWLVTEKPGIGFDDIAGLDDVKIEIRLKMIYPFAHAELARRYGVTSGGGVLLYGPPGTGKTMIAKAIAHEIDAAFYTVSPAQVMSKWVGEAEQNVRKLFEAAKAQPMSVIFLDEVEALVPKRHGDGSTVMQRVVPQILQELEGFDRGSERALLFVGATNKPWMLDEAMMRPGRMDARVYVPLPDGPARFKLLEMNFVGRPLAEDVDFGDLCDRLNGYSGADIKAIALQAAQRPFLEAVGGGSPRPIALKDILAEIAETRPSVHPSDLTRYEKFAQTGQ